MFSKGFRTIMSAILAKCVQPAVPSRFHRLAVKSEEFLATCQFNGGKYSRWVRLKSGTMPISSALIIIGGKNVIESISIEHSNPGFIFS
jgi:hypothetical protein